MNSLPVEENSPYGRQQSYLKRHENQSYGHDENLGQELSPLHSGHTEMGLGLIRNVRGNCVESGGQSLPSALKSIWEYLGTRGADRGTKPSKETFFVVISCP